jgi:hypothetical protein
MLTLCTWLLIFSPVLVQQTDVVVTLRQSNVLAQSRSWKAQNVSLLNTNGKALTRGWASSREKISDSGTYTNRREVFLEAHNLNPGTYTVLPSTFNQGEERGFVLEAFSLKPGMTLAPYDGSESGSSIFDGW